jgi:UDP-N-acetylglucosamine--N-acetylmuramyl-(pentapeptide) pyrophosphoryl-undecaprenol N-acetylglucosamine transferase
MERVLLSGGGTGGHIYPAVSIAKEIKKRCEDTDILFIGTEKGLESSIIPEEGFKLQTIKVRGFTRKLSFENIIAVKESFTGLFAAMKMIKRFEPDIVIGTGGYVCGSVLLAAAIMNIPTLIHEQNAFPGVTNKMLSRVVDVVALNFPEAAAYFPKSSKIVVTGNPIRSDIMNVTKEAGLREFEFSSDLPVVFVVGGSRGAKKINESVLAIAKHCIKHNDFQMLHMTGQTQYEAVKESYNREGIPLKDKYIKVVPYLHNMPYALAASDVIISRCGASTLSEITALGKPSILIPYPYATDNHQEYNARALEKNGAAVVILERDLNDQILYDEVMNMLSNKVKTKEMADRSRRMAKVDAAGLIFEEADKLLQKKRQ